MSPGTDTYQLGANHCMLSSCQTSHMGGKGQWAYTPEYKRAISSHMVAAHAEAASPHLGDIKASGQHICGNQDLGDACAELVHHPVSQLVVQVSPDASASVSSLLQLRHTDTMSPHTCHAEASVGKGYPTHPKTPPICEGCTLLQGLSVETVWLAAG